MVGCDCTKCNGKYVTFRTKTLHEINQDSEDGSSSQDDTLPDILTMDLTDKPDEISPETKSRLNLGGIHESLSETSSNDDEDQNNEDREETEFNSPPR